MTPTQLRAFVTIVRQGSVKGAAAELGLTEQAVSMHVAQLRKSLGDQLFSRTGSGLAFTPGGLRLAGRAVEILGLQDQTISEVGMAAGGRRSIRLGASSEFAEHGAAGLIELFTKRANDLEVELSVHSPTQFQNLLVARALDVAIGPLPNVPGAAPGSVPSLNVRDVLGFDVQVFAAADHPYTSHRVSPDDLRRADWFLGPAAAHEVETVPQMIKTMRIPEERQRIFQSDAAAWEEAIRSTTALTLAPTFAVRAEVRDKRLVPIGGPGTRRRGVWTAMVVAHEPTQTATELQRFATTPRAMQGMLRGAGVPVKNFRPAIYVTLWT